MTTPEGIQALENARYRAMLDGDLVLLDELLSEQLLYTHTDGRIDTKASYLAGLADGTPYVAIEHSTTALIVTDHAAVVRGHMRAKLQRGGVVRTLDNAVLAVWLRDGGRWQFTAFQPTPLS